MKKALSRSLCLSALMTMAACMTSPLNNTYLKSKSEPVSFEGYNTSQSEVDIYIQNQVSGNFELLGKAPADGANPLTDSQGIVWYKWSKTLQLKTESQYWIQHGDELRAKVKAQHGGLPLEAFNSSVNGAPVADCWHQSIKQGGITTMQQCGAKNAFVTLRTPCAGANQCACGGLGQPCCGTNCTSGSCQNGTCKACGGVGQPCCGTSCASGSCLNGTCKACGGVGQSCCANGACASGVCISGTCKSCGGLGQPCCANSACTSGACQNGTCKACGGHGQSCCPGNTCKAGLGLNLTCHNGVCDCAAWGESCGSVPCCTTENKCLDTVVFGVKGMRCCKSVSSNFGCN